MDIEDRILQVNRMLANLFVLYIKLHRYSWYVKGEQSFSLKGLFRHYVNCYKQHIDELVDLILSLDGQPFATMEKFIKEATLKEATADDETIEMIEQLIDDSDHVLQSIDKLLNSSADDRVSRMLTKFISSLEYTLLDMQHECEQFLK